MSRSVLPIKIRPHLIPFFYKEFDGIEANYLNKKVKACYITMQSNLGFLIRLAVSKNDLPAETSKLSMYISISDYEGSSQYTAKMYKHVSGKYSFLSVPPNVQTKVNDILEDYFRIAFVYYVNGAIRHNKCKVQEAFYTFMEEYELDEYGYNLDTLRQYYYRTEKKKHHIARIQTKPSNRILNRIPVFAMS